MMKTTTKLFRVMAIATALALAGGCSFTRSVMEKTGSVVGRINPFADEPETFTGMLVVTGPADCGLRDGCGPAFRLMSQDFSTFVALEGDIDPAHNRNLIEVIGRPRPPDGGTVEVVVVEQYRRITSDDYRIFLLDRSATHSRRLFGCDPTWDKTFAWRMDTQAPRLVITMTDNYASEFPNPWVEFEFDGNSGTLVEQRLSRPDLDPCK